MSDDEVSVLMISIVAGAMATFYTRTGPLHWLFIVNNPGIGLLRVSLFLATAWIGFVLWRYADPSVVGIYVVFYLVIGFAALKVFGQVATRLLGLRIRVDVYERRNLGAALVLSAFTLGTGLIFGGSLWGEADPSGDGEGGWWIPVAFFLLGWAALMGMSAIYLWRDKESVIRKIIQDRNIRDARAFASYILGVSIALVDGVAGDFYGWAHGLLSFLHVAMMILAHELLQNHFRSKAMTTVEGTPGQKQQPLGHDDGRIWEALFYIGIAMFGWFLHRAISLLAR